MVDLCIAGNSAVDGCCGNPACVCAPEPADFGLVVDPAEVMDDLFGPVISSYTRAQAIEDGFLVDLSTFSFREGLTVLQEAGIKFPVAITRAAYNLTIQEDGAELPPCQDLSGRMWDVVYMMRVAIGRSNGPELTFCVYVNNWNKARTKGVSQKIILKAICGPGDTGEPVITIMLPSED